MQRLLTIIVAAVAGSVAGYLSHQVLSRKAEPAQNPPLVVGAPLSVVAAAALLGFVSGKRGVAAALGAGLLGATLLGTRLDDKLPGVAEARRRQTARLGRGSTP